MNTVTIVIVILIISICVYLYSNKKKYVKSNVDGKHYKVLNGTTEMMSETADTLAEIHSRIERLIEYLKIHMASDVIVKTLESKYSNKIISEAVIQSGFTSYTVNKKNIHVCLRSRDLEKRIFDINTLMYVIIHELAHLISESVGHGEEFRRIFKYLLSQSLEIGIYTYVDYSKTPVEYCGMQLTSNII